MELLEQSIYETAAAFPGDLGAQEVPRQALQALAVALECNWATYRSKSPRTRGSRLMTCSQRTSVQGSQMKPADAYEDTVDLLDADHKAVKKLFIDFSALCDDGAAPEAKRPVSDKICQALLVHMQIEEEIFYPAVRAGTGDGTLIEEAIDEHAQARKRSHRSRPWIRLTRSTTTWSDVSASSSMRTY
jgi:hypothetical protein